MNAYEITDQTVQTRPAIARRTLDEPWRSGASLLNTTRTTRQVGAMLVERLTELQQKLTDGQLLDNAECFALISELWRLKASIASKLIERDVARDESACAQAALDEATTELESLRRELD